MTSSDLKIRFDELCAGRAIGDLSPEESRELDALCQQLGLAPDADFDLLAATLEIDAIQSAGEAMPASLSSRLHDWAEKTSAPPVVVVVRPVVPAWKKILTHPANGWAAAAAAIVISLNLPKGTPSLAPAQAESRLRA
jgi:hypothetical protein